MEVMEERNDTQINENVKSIKPIHEETVHKICSGQVVLSLAIAVKELVENSLDAGATVIDVRLKNYGTDSIEVSDNGFGVAEENFAALTLKYHTSKLNDYSDLLGVKSFGFRGEALSSLCALANLTVITRHKNTEYATKIEYDHKSNITKKTLCSRQIGTTVILSNLFHSLPVRQKELQKNARREFNKMTQLLYAYCLISKGVRISCTNQNSNNAKSTVVATQGSSSYEDNIVCVFGHKQLHNILEIKPEYVANIKGNIFRGLSGEVEQAQDSFSIEDVEIDLSEDSNDVDSAEKPGSQSNQSVTNSQKSQGYKNCVSPIEFTGYISSCTHGCGRSSTDRQFIYINSRPCEPTKIIKLINDVYRQYNPNQYPFVFLNISIGRDGVDVNVTPDKRKIFLTKEKIILETLKASLLKLFENIPRTLKVDTTINVHSKNVDDDFKPEVNQPRIYSSFIQRFANKNVDNTDIQKKNELKRKSTTMLDFVSTKTVKVDPDLETENSINEENETTIPNNNNSNKDNVTLNDDIKEDVIKEIEETNHKHTDILYLENTDCIPDTQIRNLSDVIEKKPLNTKCERTLSIEGDNFKKKKTKIVITDEQNLGKNQRKSVTLKTSLDHVKALTSIYNEHKEKLIPERIKFWSSINPVFNKKCEEELSKEISKDSFKNMHIVGQFNLGFILTKLDEDLFIIDQHATDEIYNFETLQKTTELTKQVLVIPQQLELSGVNEQILIDNLDVFKKNGFTFDINEDALPTKRVKLLTIPMSRNWIFGKDDIEELLFMLKESPSEYCRPSRVRAMFASRACRKSVMIGTALAKSDMKTLVDHMADIDKPWNCPHGRPTIRHLVNLAMVHTNKI